MGRRDGEHKEKFTEMVAGLFSDFTKTTNL